MTEFETSALMAIDVSQQSLREARATIEDDLGDIEVDVSATASDDISASRDHRPRMSADGGFDEMQALAIHRNELLSDIADELEAGNISERRGGGSSGLLTGLLLGKGGGKLGGVLGGAASGAAAGSALGKGGLKGGLSSLLLSGAMTPGSPMFFGKGGLKEGFESPEAESRANENAESTRQLVGLEGGQAFPGLDQMFHDQVSSITDSITAAMPQTPTNQSNAADLLNQYRTSPTLPGVEGRTQATDRLNPGRTADSRGNRAADSKRQQPTVEHSPTYNVQLERQGDLDKDMERLKRDIDRIERSFSR